MMKRKNYILLFLLLLSGNFLSLTAADDPAVARKAQYFYLEGVLLKTDGKFDAAFEMFRHAAAIDSTSSAVLFELSEFYLRLNRIDVALSCMKQAISVDESNNFNYKVLYARLLIVKGALAEAVPIYESLIEDHPENPEINYYLAELYAEQKDFLKAVEVYNNLELGVGIDKDISVRKYQLYEAAGEEKKGVEEIERLIEKFPSDAAYPILLGSIYLEKGHPDKAYENYQRAAEIDPDDSDLLVAMVSYYDAVGDKEQSSRLMEKALGNPDVEIEIKLSILSQYMDMLHRSGKDMNSVNALFDILLDQHPQMAELNQAYGILLLSQEREEEGRFQLQLAIEKDPSLHAVWMRLLSVYLAKQEYDNVITTSQKALMHHPKSAGLYYFLGVTYYQTGRLQEALAAFLDGAKVIEEDNKELRSDYYGQIGDIYYQLGMKDESFASYDEALVYVPENSMVLNNYAYFLSIENRDLSKAENMSALTVRLDPKNSTYLDTYAWIFYMQGNYTLAKIYIESAIGNGGGEEPEILEHYGDILLKLGDKEGAVREWKKAFLFNPSSESLRTKIANVSGEKEYEIKTLDQDVIL